MGFLALKLPIQLTVRRVYRKPSCKAPATATFGTSD
jgi:hypothetical protein